MKTLFKLLFGDRARKTTSPTGFFEDAANKEHRQIIEEVIAKSNKDQRDLIDKSKQKFSVGV